MIVVRPKNFCLVSGHGEGYMPLNAFDLALLNAGVGDTNLVRMSSILPPNCVQVDKFDLPPGALLPLAYASAVSSNVGEVIASAVAVAIPEDPNLAGVIMEHSAKQPLEIVERTVREMARQSFLYRGGRALKEVKSIGVEHTVIEHGATFAAIVLWDKD